MFSFQSESRKTREALAVLSSLAVKAGGGAGGTPSRAAMVSIVPVVGEGETEGVIEYEVVSDLGCGRATVPATDITLGDDVDPEDGAERIYLAPGTLAVLIEGVKTDRFGFDYDSSDDRPVTVAPVLDSGKVGKRRAARSVIPDPIPLRDQDTIIYQFDQSADESAVDGTGLVDAVKDVSLAFTPATTEQSRGVHISAEEGDTTLQLLASDGDMRVAKTTIPITGDAAASRLVCRIDHKVLSGISPALVVSGEVLLSIGVNREAQIFVAADKDGGGVEYEFFLETLDEEGDMASEYPAASLLARVEQLLDAPSESVTADVRALGQVLGDVSRLGGQDSLWAIQKVVRLAVTPQDDGGERALVLSVDGGVNYEDQVTVSATSLEEDRALVLETRQSEIKDLMLGRGKQIGSGDEITMRVAVADDGAPVAVVVEDGEFAVVFGVDGSMEQRA